MNDSTFKALQDSLAHWRRLEQLIRANDWEGIVEEGFGASECALCDLFYEHECIGCPISTPSGSGGDRVYIYCMGTPYSDALNVLETGTLKHTYGTTDEPFGRRYPDSATKIVAVQHMREFVERLAAKEREDRLWRRDLVASFKGLATYLDTLSRDIRPVIWTMNS